MPSKIKHTQRIISAFRINPSLGDAENDTSKLNLSRFGSSA